MRLVAAVLAVAIALAHIGSQSTNTGSAGVLTAGASFSFSAAGDHGATGNSTASLNSLAGDSSIEFHLALGDLSYNDITPESAWCTYVTDIVGSGFPFQLITGNHEDEPSGDDGFIDNFAACLPDQLSSTGNYGHQYYFDYPTAAPLARVIMTDIDLRLSGSTQKYCDGETINCDWLRARIQEAKALNLWVVVGMHKVCISTGNKGCSIGQPVVDMMITEGVDLVLQGHDHDYQRSHALSCITVNSFSPACIADDGADDLYVKGAGTVFVITGTFGGGAHTAINTGDPEFRYFHAWNGGGGTSTGASPARGYTKYTVTDSSVTAEFVPTTGGSYMDGFTIAPTLTPTPSPTPSPTPTPTHSPTPSPTPTPTPTPMPTPKPTATPAPPPTSTPTATATPTAEPTPTATPTPAALAIVQEPQALPESGGTISSGADGTRWAAIVISLLVMGAGGLYVAKLRRGALAIVQEPQALPESGGTISSGADGTRWAAIAISLLVMGAGWLYVTKLRRGRR